MNEDTLFETEQYFDDFESGASHDEAVETSKYLIFVTDSLHIGIHTDNVMEILTDYSITYLPMVPEFIRGIINLRGQMLPILDIRLRLGKEPLEEGLVIVLIINGTQIGILVDAVDQMIDVPDGGIQPMPARNTQKLVNGMYTIPDGSGTMLALDCDQLLSHG